jgi:hypothetical protein
MGLPRIFYRPWKCVNLSPPEIILYATDGQNALTGYNLPTRQSPANSAELGCGRALLR